MKTRVLLVALSVLGVFGLVAQTAIASIGLDPIGTGSLVKLDYGLGNANGGGPFTATTTTTWVTFCIEETPHAEYFSPGSTYTVLSMSSNQASLTKNVISDAGKWFYYEIRLALANDPSLDPWFANNGYVLSNLVAWGPTEQNVIWAETSNSVVAPLGPLYTPPAASAEAAIVAYIDAKYVKAEAGAVEVFNPYPAPPGYQGEAQSMLAVVPEPVSFIVWSFFGIGMVGIAMRLRRR
jgi:hypothetical protein